MPPELLGQEWEEKREDFCGVDEDAEAELEALKFRIRPHPGNSEYSSVESLERHLLDRDPGTSSWWKEELNKPQPSRLVYTGLEYAVEFAKRRKGTRSNVPTTQGSSHQQSQTLTWKDNSQLNTLQKKERFIHGFRDGDRATNKMDTQVESGLEVDWSDPRGTLRSWDIPFDRYFKVNAEAAEAGIEYFRETYGPWAGRCAEMSKFKEEFVNKEYGMHELGSQLLDWAKECIDLEEFPLEKIDNLGSVDEWLDKNVPETYGIVKKWKPQLVDGLKEYVLWLGEAKQSDTRATLTNHTEMTEELGMSNYSRRDTDDTQTSAAMTIQGPSWADTEGMDEGVVVDWDESVLNEVSRMM
ncbi:uncharacterized protein IL334_002260 [Kwoniella shivajii]|uniref:Uncharacterized protein n=1 Tax=Kwoniella shivajii TaxID=564305 RepID=A0ABZ1CU83_9TREE|nr:hypothetical protein IL334_002260 [Kwoniella shivajii]